MVTRKGRRCALATWGNLPPAQVLGDGRKSQSSGEWLIPDLATLLSARTASFKSKMPAPAHAFTEARNSRAIQGPSPHSDR